MNRVRGMALFVMLGFVSGVAVDGWAQRERGGQGRFAGGMMNQSTLMAADVLLLPEDTTEMLEKADADARQAAVEELMGDRQRMQDMSREERMAKMEEVNTAITEGVVERMNETLTEDELEMLKTVLGKRVIRPVPELRALRMISLTEEQREELLPYTFAIGNTIPDFDPRRMGNRGSVRPQRDEDAEAAFELATEAWMAKTETVLTDTQKTEWETNLKTVQEEMESRREMMRRGFGGGGGGRGPQN